MKTIYFNHSRIVHAGDTEINGIIFEIHDLITTLKTIKLVVYEGFWSTAIQSGTLRACFNKQDNRERAYIAILSLMTSGPYFQEQPQVRDLKIFPVITEDCFGRKLIHICHHDGQQHVLSLSAEKCLTSPVYTAAPESKNLEIVNLIGQNALLEKLKKT